jgi:hypothetical protein
VAGTDSREDDEAAKIELTYSNTSNINPARQMLGKLVVCISQVAWTKLWYLSYAPSRMLREG